MVLPSQLLQNINPAWKTCSGDVRGFYDPPYALQQAFVAATPTPAGIPWASTKATPASAPDADQPDPTSGVIQGPTSHGPIGGDPHRGNPSSNDPNTKDLPNNSADQKSQGGRPSTKSPEGADAPHLPISDIFRGLPSANPVSLAKSPSRTEPQPAPIAELSHILAQGMSSGFSDAFDPQDEGNAMSANVANGKANSDLPPQGSHEIVSAASYESQVNDFASLASKAGVTTADGINAVINKADDKDTIIGNDESDPSDDSANSVGRGDALPESGGSGVQKADPKSLQATAKDDSSLLGTIVHGESEEDHESGHGDQASPDSAPGSRIQLNPITLHATSVVKGHKESIDGIQLNGHDGMEDSAEVGGQPILTDPSNPKDLLIGTQHLRKGQTANVDGTSISFGPSGLVIGRTSTVPLDAMLKGTSGLSVGENSPVAPMSNNRKAGLPGAIIPTVSGVAIAADQFNPNVAIFDGTKTIRPGESTAIGGTLVSLGMNGLIIGGQTTILLPFGDSGSTKANAPITSIKPSFSIDSGSADGVMTEASFTISGHRFTAYEMGHDDVAVILGGNSLSTTVSFGGAAITLDGQIVSIASDGLYVRKSGIGESKEPWSTETFKGADLPLTTSPMTGSGRTTAPQTTANSAAQLVQPSGAEKTSRLEIWLSCTLWIWVTIFLDL